MFNTSITKNILDSTITTITERKSAAYDNQSTRESMNSQPAGSSVTSDVTNQLNTGTEVITGRSVDVSSPKMTSYHPLTGSAGTMPTVESSSRPSDSGNCTIYIHSMITPLSGNGTNLSDFITSLSGQISM